MLKENLTLAGAITIATQMEFTGIQAKVMTSGQTLPVQAVPMQEENQKGRQSCQGSQMKAAATVDYAAQYKPTPAAGSAPRSCFHCGSDQHLAKQSV